MTSITVIKLLYISQTLTNVIVAEQQLET